MRHLLTRVVVHVADSNVIKTTESPDYDLIRLVSDIGGQLGLCTGQLGLCSGQDSAQASSDSVLASSDSALARTLHWPARTLHRPARTLDRRVGHHTGRGPAAGRPRSARHRR